VRRGSRDVVERDGGPGGVAEKDEAAAKDAEGGLCGEGGVDVGEEERREFCEDGGVQGFVKGCGGRGGGF